MADDERTNDSARALLVEANPRDGLPTLRVLRGATPKVRACCSVRDAGDIDEHDVVVVNVDGLAQEDLEFLCNRGTAPSGRHLILLSSQHWGEAALARVVGATKPTALLGNSDNGINTQSLAVTLKKILTGDIFGMSKYFGWGTDVETLTLTSSTQRGELVDFAKAFADRMQLHSRIASQVVSVLDELVTNALYNAPVDESGAPLFRNKSRAEDAAVPGSKAVRVEFSSDGTSLGVAVNDFFGSADPELIADRLWGGMGQQQHVVQTEASGGSGIGLHQVVRGVSRLVFNSQPGVRTEVVALFDMLPRYRDYIRQPKSVGIFVSAGE